MYPETPGFQSHSRTSQAAAESINVSSMEGRVLHCLDRACEYGMTADEIQQDLIAFAWPHVQAGTVGARLRGLELKGIAVKIEETRNTRTGKAAFVWVTPEFVAGRKLAPTKESTGALTVRELQLMQQVRTLELRLESALATIESLEGQLRKARGQLI